MQRSPVTDYSRTQKVLHWITVVLIALQYLVFDELGRAFRTWRDDAEGAWTTTVIAHMVIGTSILVLTAWRIWLRTARGAPPPPADEPELARLAAHWTHVGLYALFAALPLVGLGAWFLKLGILGDIHEILSNVLLVLLAAHVGAVAVHQFWWRTELLQRMR